MAAAHLLRRPKAVANTLWGYAKLGCHPGDFLLRLAAAAKARLRDFNAQNVANSIWALATLGERPDDEFLEQVGWAGWLAARRIMAVGFAWGDGNVRLRGASARHCPGSGAFLPCFPALHQLL